MNREPAAGKKRPGKVVPWLCRWLLAIVFLSAGSAKLRGSPQAFADNVASFRLAPAWLVSPLALALPPFELLVGAALAADRPRRMGAAGALVLAGVFLAAVAASIIRGIPVDCGCFGPGASWLPLTTTQRLWLDLGRNLVLAAAALGFYRHQLAADTKPADS